MKINLRESLNKIDLATDNKYDLLNTFDSKKLSDENKKKLAEAIENNSIASINRVLHESEEQLYKVVISSGATKRNFESALYEDEAEGIVDYYGGRWIDENGFEWSMYVEEDDDSTEHAMVDDDYDMEDDDERAQREIDAYDLLDEDWGPDEWEETDFLDNDGKKVYINNIKEAEDIDDLKDIVHDLYWHDKGLFAMLRNFPKDKSFEWIQNRMIEVIESTMNESLTEASYGGAYDIEDDMYFTKEELVEFADNICEDLAKEFGYKYDIADVYMDSPTKLHIELVDNHDIEIDINVRINMRRIKKPSDLEKAYHNSTLESFKNRFLEEYQYYNFDESLIEDTVKQNGKWVNKGSEGTHGKFKTKKAADAQRKAMFANGYKAENLKESLYDMFLIEFKDEDGRTWQEEYEAYSAKNSVEQFRYDYPKEDGYKLVRIYKLTDEGYADIGYPFYWEDIDESLEEQINLPGYAVKYTTGYSGNGVNSGKTEWFRTEEERDRRVRELKDKNYTEIKTWKMDNFYHTLPKEECLEESNMSYVKSAFAFDIYKDGDKYAVVNGDGDTVYESDNTLDCLKWAKKNSSKGYDFTGRFDFSRLKESLKEDFDDEYESDFDNNEVEEGNHVFADGEEYVWVERIAGPIYLDFDKWAVWSARVFVDPRDFMTIHSDGKNYDFDGDAFKEKAMAAPIVYFVVEEDTGFIDWGPEDNEIAAKDFLNGKQEDWDNDEYYGESLEKNLDEWYVHTIHYEDIGDGREYDYEVDHEEVLDYLSEIAIDEEDAPEDTEEYLKWVEDNFDELFNKYEYEIEEHFREDASQEEYDRRHSSYKS